MLHFTVLSVKVMLVIVNKPDLNNSLEGSIRRCSAIVVVVVVVVVPGSDELPAAVDCISKFVWMNKSSSSVMSKSIVKVNNLFVRVNTRQYLQFMTNNI